MSLGVIQPGGYESIKNNYFDFTESEFAQRDENGKYYSTFEVTKTTNLFAQLEDLPFDLDLYLGEIDTTTGEPISWSNGTPIVFNSSTNPGQENESIFAQVMPGKYWLGLRINITQEQSTYPTEEQLLKNFELILDGRSFDQC